MKVVCRPRTFGHPRAARGISSALPRRRRTHLGSTSTEIERRLPRASHGDCRKSIMQPNFQEARPGSLPLKRSNPMLPAPHARSPAAYELTDALRMLSTLARFVPSFVNFAVLRMIRSSRTPAIKRAPRGLLGQQMVHTDDNRLAGRGMMSISVRVAGLSGRRIHGGRQRPRPSTSADIPP